MAGRGTDIKPTKEAIELGGLYVLGTDKAESRRIDNQLRGRSGRQGDVGTSKFFISLDDQLIRRFASYEAFKEAYSDSKGKEITSKTLRLQFNHAQKKIEGFNYDSRKSVLNYDDVIRQQRDLIYAQRDLILTSNDVDFILKRMFMSAARSIVKNGEYYLHSNYNYNALIDFLNENIGKLVSFKFDIDEIVKVQMKMICLNILQILSYHFMKNEPRMHIITLINMKLLILKNLQF
nr:hypothetical protein [Mycoplasmopsis cynos]